MADTFVLRGIPMGETNRFFIWLWRFNAVLIALLGAVVAAFVAFAASENFVSIPKHNSPADNFLAAPQPPKENISYELNDAGTNLEGTNEVVFNLQRSSGPTPGSALRFSSDGGRSENVVTVNLLVVDGASGTSHWLFKGVDRIIWTGSADQLKTVTASDAPKSPVVALIIEALAAKPDKNGTLATDGPDTLYYYRTGSNEAVKFFSVDNIRSIDQLDADRLLVMYGNGRLINAAVFSTRDFKLVSQSAVPSVPK